MDFIKLPGGVTFRRNDKVIIFELSKPSRVLSTSYLNGGCRDDLSHLFNYCEIYNSPDGRCEMRAPTNREHLSLIASELELPPHKTTGLSTAAMMTYARPDTLKYVDFSVTAVVTAGIDVNGSRAGDPACWHEKAGVPIPAEPGTINIFLFINASLDAGALAKALVTATEAKTAALQELLAPSCISSGLATGSGTDGVIIVSNLEALTSLTDAGQHGKLGEYIGRVVKNTVKEALVADIGFRSYACGSVLKRMKRFGLKDKKMAALYQPSAIEGGIDQVQFSRALNAIDSDDRYIGIATLYAHLLDLLHWKLIGRDEALRLAAGLLEDLAKTSGYPLPGISNPLPVGNNLLNCLVEAFALNWALLAVKNSSSNKQEN